MFHNLLSTCLEPEWLSPSADLGDVAWEFEVDEYTISHVQPSSGITQRPIPSGAGDTIKGSWLGITFTVDNWALLPM